MNDLSTHTATAAIRRLSGLTADRIHVVVNAAIGDGFRVWAADGDLHVDASGAGAAVAGYAAFARRTGVAHVSRFGTRPVDRDLPAGVVVERRAQLGLRVAYNLTVPGYTTPYFDWAQWEAELDLLAASGINAAHVTLGQELVYLETFTRFGHTEEEVLRWLGPPSHQPWLWLNSIQNFGKGTTRTLVEKRVELARRVIRRMRELDITPILPGFSGIVPPKFAERNEGALVVPQGLWFMDAAGPERPDWLDTTSDNYAAVAETFYAAQRSAFGSSGMWAVDLLHEGGTTGGVDLAEAARGVQRAMTAADPDSTWVLQGWIGNPRRELLEAIDLSRVLVLDLTGEAADADGGFLDAKWALGILPNYGGRTVLYGDVAAVAATPKRWAADAEPSYLAGLTNMAEGVGNNPVLWDLFSDLAWADGEIQLGPWLDDWTAARYGAADEHARAAWQTLFETAFGPWRHNDTGAIPAESKQAMAGNAVDAADAGREPVSEGPLAVLDMTDPSLANFATPYGSTDSVIAAIPSLRANQASMVGPRALPYPENALIPALRELLAAADSLHTTGFAYDLADVARQVADDAARAGLRAIAEAAEAKDLGSYDERVAEYLELIDAQEAVLRTNEHFLLGRWLDDARAWGSTVQESTYLAEEAKRLLTSWGYEDSTFLIDYGNRGWSGLVGDYYRSRWSAWLGRIRDVLAGEATTPIDWYRFTDEWIRSSTQYPSRPHGDLKTAAKAVLEIAERLTSAK
ncbi:alpha-N-acetylglucosaminidase [Sinosporangium siamense]|uniref:Alpha-N-acetylglucosaminidase n=1 Tax=Sinosporangium siamense TaxID=1367973 RepID=A0A919RN92_9ACTN|nr:alpha-N-acetylglucosaminidase [Sinosporangium siamense]GII95109.1 alpha-N-acetylglucosaminidase [Sinosporangium siamense]